MVSLAMPATGNLQLRDVIGASRLRIPLSPLNRINRLWADSGSCSGNASRVLHSLLISPSTLQNLRMCGRFVATVLGIVRVQERSLLQGRDRFTRLSRPRRNLHVIMLTFSYPLAEAYQANSDTPKTVEMLRRAIEANPSTPVDFTDLCLAHCTF